MSVVRVSMDLKNMNFCHMCMDFVFTTHAGVLQSYIFLLINLVCTVYKRKILRSCVK